MGDVYINMNEICPLYARIWDLEKKKRPERNKMQVEKTFLNTRENREERKKNTQSSL